MKKSVIIYFILGLSLSVTAFQRSDSVDEVELFQNIKGLAKIDSLNNYAIELGKINPELRQKIGRRCYKLSKNENYKLGQIQSLFNIGAGFFHLTNFDSAQAYYKKSYKLAAGSNNLTWKMNLATNLGQVFSNKYQFDSANVYYKIGVDNAVLVNDSSAIGYLYNSMGAAYWKKGEFPNAIKYYKLGLKIHKKFGNYRRIARCYNSIGSSYWNLNNNILALEYYLGALEAQSHYSELSSSITLNNVGLLYLGLEDTLLAKKYFKEGLKNAVVANSVLGTGYSFLNLGDLNFKRGKYNRALELYNKSITYYQEIKDKNGIAQILNKIGEVYFKTKQYKLAEKKFLEAYRISKDNRLKLTQTESLINFCRIQIYQGKSNKVGQNLDRAFMLAKEGNFAQSKLKIFDLQSIVNENLKNYKLALFYKKKHEVLRDSLFSENSLRILSDTKEKYESQKREKANIELQHLNNIQKLDIENKKNIMLYTTSGTVFSVFVIIYLIYLNNLRKKRNRALLLAKKEVELVNEKLNRTNELLLHANSTKDKFFSIISHDLKNPFNNLLGATQILKSDYFEMSDEDKIELVQIISNDTNKLYSLLENLLFWANSQTGKLKANKTNIFLYQIVYDTYLLFKSSAESKGITVEIDVPKSLVVSFDEFMLSTILRNLLSNAIKFTYKGGRVMFTAKVVGDKIHLYVKDEGVGIKKDNIVKLFDESSNYKELGTNKEKGTGLGLILCYDFVKENNAEIKVSSVVEKGTTFELILESAG